MESEISGYTRKIDELGRVGLPVGARKELDLEEKDSVVFSVDKENKALILKLHEKAAEPKCTFCGAKVSAMYLYNKGICVHCLEFIKHKTIETAKTQPGIK